MTIYTLIGHLTEDDIPDGTTELRVYNYSRTSLIIPPSLTKLYCDYNMLTVLVLPPSLTKLNCSNNHLTRINCPTVGYLSVLLR